MCSTVTPPQERRLFLRLSASDTETTALAFFKQNTFLGGKCLTGGPTGPGAPRSPWGVKKQIFSLDEFE